MKQQIDWQKVDGLIPAIIQDSSSKDVLMLGYMNEEALAKTESTGLATFYSRTKQRLWTKGETSGNTLAVDAINLDCDQDTLLIEATPAGPVCHRGTQTCFGDRNQATFSTLEELEQIVKERKTNPSPDSYTSKLFKKGRDKIAQKVGEEGVEVVIASKNEDRSEFLEECADLMYHLTVLLADREEDWAAVMGVLKTRRT